MRLGRGRHRRSPGPELPPIPQSLAGRDQLPSHSVSGAWILLLYGARTGRWTRACLCVQCGQGQSRVLSYNSSVSGGILMVECPVCDGKIDVDEEEVDEGETISCDECGAALKVIGTSPLELESAEEATADEEDEEGFVEEEEEEADEDWK